MWHCGAHRQPDGRQGADCRFPRRFERYEACQAGRTIATDLTANGQRALQVLHVHKHGPPAHRGCRNCTLYSATQGKNREKKTTVASETKPKEKYYDSAYESHDSHTSWLSTIYVLNEWTQHVNKGSIKLRWSLCFAFIYSLRGTAPFMASSTLGVAYYDVVCASRINVTTTTHVRHFQWTFLTLGCDEAQFHKIVFHNHCRVVFKVAYTVNANIIDWCVMAIKFSLMTIQSLHCKHGTSAKLYAYCIAFTTSEDSNHFARTQDVESQVQNRVHSCIRHAKSTILVQRRRRRSKHQQHVDSTRRRRQCVN